MCGETMKKECSTNALTMRRIYTDRIDDIVARINSSGTAAWYLTDRQGSVRNMTDNSGTVQNTIAYNGFGGVTSESSPSNGDRYKYTGREQNGNTELQNNRGRYYSTAIGRWISEDPIGFEAQDPNVYRYVGNNSINALDPSGLKIPDYTNDNLPQGWVVQRKGQKQGIKGIFRWKIETRPSIKQQYAIRAEFWFEPSPKNTATAIGFLQVITESTVGGKPRWAPPNFPLKRVPEFHKSHSADSAKGTMVDFVPGYTPIFYGAVWDDKTKRWKANTASQLGVGGKKIIVAYTNDIPNRKEARSKKGDVVLKFETAVITFNSFEVLGVFKWGFRIKDNKNASLELLGGDKSDLGVTGFPRLNGV